MPFTRWGAAALIAASLVAVGEDARADDRAAAQALFDQGRALVAKGAFAEACPKLAESLRLDRGTGTMLWLADCYENNGQNASAWAMFKEAAADAMKNSDPRERIARDRAAKLEPGLARLTIVVPEPTPGLEVRRDGTAAREAEWGVPVPVDPGSHVLIATAPGRSGWSTMVTIPRTPTTTSVAVPVLARLSGGGPTGAGPGADPAPDPHVGRTQRILGLGLAGLGVVGLGLGTFFSFHAKSTYDDSAKDGHCRPDNRCDAIGRGLRDDAQSEATIATIALTAGVVALAGGIVLYLTAPRH